MLAFNCLEQHDLKILTADNNCCLLDPCVSCVLMIAIFTAQRTQRSRVRTKRLNQDFKEELKKHNIGGWNGKI